ncbi:hypothetical protein IZU99_08050 [Oscillospiraceae bacterium CM]|nr:hypothetical protein IZU99_08050 [Oscillospiraceae bacterium CM]
MVNIDQETFIDAARACICDRFKGEVQNYKNHVEEVLSLYNSTVYSDAITIDMPMFFDNNGNINIIATIYGIAGDGYECIINTSLSQTTPITSKDFALDPLYPQVIEVLANGSNASITLYDWSDGKWTKEYSCLGYIGKNGITPNKSDGDGKTPKGKFALGFVFGLTQPETNLLFKSVIPGTVWVDDINSEYYNTWQLNNAPFKDWNSSEDLYSDCESLIYAAITFDFNGDGLGTNGSINSATSGDGAALWFNGRYTLRNGTPGDIDINKADIIAILKLLDINKTPIIDIKEATSGSDYKG